MSSIKNIVWFAASVVLLRVLFDNIYAEAISPLYSYAGLTYNPTITSRTISWGLLMGGLVLVTPFLKRNDFVIPNAAILLFVLFFVPWTSFIACKPQTMDFVLCEATYWAMVFICMYRKFNVIRLPQIVHTANSTALTIITVTLILVVVYVSGVYAHFRLNFNLTNVYDLRLEARGFHLPLLLSYLWPAAANILPLALIYFMSKKRWSVVALIAVVILMNFSINGSKSTLFKLFLCFLLYFFVKKKFLRNVAFVLAILVLAGIVMSKLQGDSFIASLIVRRTFYVTSLLDSYYYEIVNLYSPAYFSHKVNGHEVAFYIGDIFFDSDAMRANNGLFSDAYMNLGLIGIFVYPIIYSVFFNWCETLFKGHSDQIKFYAVFLLVLTMRSSEFTTALLTHGLFLLCLTLAVMPRDINIKRFAYRRTAATTTPQE